MFSVEKMYITEKEASVRYGVSVKWFRNHRKANTGPSFLTEDRKFLYSVSETDSWFRNKFKMMGTPIVLAWGSDTDNTWDGIERIPTFLSNYFGISTDDSILSSVSGVILRRLSLTQEETIGLPRICVFLRHHDFSKMGKAIRAFGGRSSFLKGPISFFLKNEFVDLGSVYYLKSGYPNIGRDFNYKSIIFAPLDYHRKLFSLDSQLKYPELRLPFPDEESDPKAPVLPQIVKGLSKDHVLFIDLRATSINLTALKRDANQIKLEVKETLMG